MEIKIALAASRKSRTWKNKTIDWHRFVKHCTTTKYTTETLPEYLAMTKDKQGDIKDVGGFVGGHVIDEKAGRTKSNIAFRSCLTLDIDSAPVGLWDEFAKAYTGAVVCYSTHKHTPDCPRLRIVVPFSREVTAEEYPAISRRFCKDFGLLEYADHTTHEINRLFYMPSTSKGAEFFYRNQDGEALDVDEVLGSYDDWRDCAQWPLSTEEGQGPRAYAPRAQDPMEKPGVIGAFCRTYTMTEAIEKFLPDVYEPCDTAGGDRYTYKQGSTSGGAIVYDDKFLYSNHATDPTAGTLCNAFDLIRLHRYAQLDSETKPGTPTNKLPSFLAMSDFCINDPQTKMTLFKEKEQTAVDDFAGIDLDDETAADGTADDKKWAEALTRDRKGRVLNTLNNLRLIILNDRIFKGIRYDMHARADVTDIPQLKGAEGSRKIDDESLGKLIAYVEGLYDIKLNLKGLKESLTATRSERGFNPVKDFIKAVEWDGVRRVDTLLIDYLGAVDNKANREMTRKWIVAAVARAFDPGCTFQNVLTLTGPQNIGKSTFLSILAGSPERLCDGVCLSDNDANRIQATEGAWIVELNELNGLSRSEWQGLKGYISRRDDRRYRKYAYTRSDEARRFVFAATTNDSNFLREADKGNRRWWIVPVKGKGPVGEWIDRLRDEVPQIWAEAYQLYRRGENICSVSDHTAEYLAKLQWEYSEDAIDPMPGMIDAFLDTLLPADWETRTKAQRRAYFRDREPLDAVGTVRRDKICAVVYLYENEGRESGSPGYKAAAIKFNAAMRGKPDWEFAKGLTFPIYGRQYGFCRKPIATDDDDLL